MWTQLQLFQIWEIRLQPIKLIDSFTLYRHQRCNVSVKSSSIPCWGKQHMNWTWPLHLLTCLPELIQTHLTCLCPDKQTLNTHLKFITSGTSSTNLLLISPCTQIRRCLSLTLLHLLHHTAMYLHWSSHCRFFLFFFLFFAVLYVYLLCLCSLYTYRFVPHLPHTAIYLWICTTSPPSFVPYGMPAFHIIQFTCEFVTSNTYHLVMGTLYVRFCVDLSPSPPYLVNFNLPAGMPPPHL